jgi:hypothetical protein
MRHLDRRIRLKKQSDAPEPGRKQERFFIQVPENFAGGFTKSERDSRGSAFFSRNPYDLEIFDPGTVRAERCVIVANHEDHFEPFVVLPGQVVKQIPSYQCPGRQHQRNLGFFRLYFEGIPASPSRPFDLPAKKIENPVFNRNGPLTFQFGKELLLLPPAPLVVVENLLFQFPVLNLQILYHRIDLGSIRGIEPAVGWFT